jgi:uncharacterized protein
MMANHMAQKTIIRTTAGLLIGLAVLAGAAGPASAQRYYRGPGFFERLFGPGGGYGPIERNVPSQQVDSSRAPAPKKSDTTPTLSIMVMGDSMADWLGYGLEEAFSESPEIAVLRKVKAHSGLIRYEARGDLDWWHVARDLLGKDKVDFVVMMLGVDDRTNIRETQAEKNDRNADKKKAQDSSKEAAKEPAKDGAKDAAKDNKDTKPDQEADADDLIAPEPQRGGNGGVVEFRTERWEQIYTKRIDETIAALKSKGVPVLWVGLPSIRGTRSTADAVYLNDLYRARAEKAGITYVDVWDGFVDEGGKFTYTGPDFEGQNRRLRSGDGVHFTKSGARKLAHYAERELRRFMANRTAPMAMPSDTQQVPAASGPAARPVAGPVVPLTGTASGSEELLGGGASRPVHSDPVATSVLVKGEPVAPAPGRADDFKWPRGGADAAATEPLSPTAAAARAEPVAPPRAAPKKNGKDSKDAARETGKDGKDKAAGKPKAGNVNTRASARPPQQGQQR